MKVEIIQSGREPREFFIDDKYRDMVLLVLGHLQCAENPELTIPERFGKHV